MERVESPARSFISFKKMFQRTCVSLLRRSLIARCAATSLTPTPVTLLSEEEQLLVDSVRRFNQDVVKPLSKKMDEAECMDNTIIKEAFEAGLMSIEIPTAHGGGGMSFFSSILAIEELAKEDPSVAVFVDVHNTLVNNTFFRYATEAQREKFLPDLATQAVGCFCLTETGSGSDAFALKTRAEKKGDGWVINGSKMFITNGANADIFLVMANVDPSKGYKGITCFVVDKRKTDGVKVVSAGKKLGIRASSTAEIFFHNVEVPESNILGGIGKGYAIAIGVLNEGRIGIGAQMVGIAQGAMDHVMPYLFQRKQFGTRIGDFQAVEMQYAQCATHISAARLMVYNAARKKTMQQPFIKDAAMAKLFASQVAEETASKAIEWAGGVGYMRDFGLERFYRDAKIGAIYEGTSIIQLQTIAKLLKKEYE
ncbi:putative acyl-CoA dehydrogenase [Trypanosoma theileri]|uniref:Short/branched chain specific acyl-CoA dehydrogenase, mitochondrial n=1 Tax=Trypanosoma theileri TaxID=67003 RepID=A0A1X0P5J1_9TRYP|nr:putative acyl-CoA dehydrogenase [Trypanosoma theileri]ORC92197.1 putative acyl-CoA dehydrogenase [Trypanosoma theileri]